MFTYIYMYIHISVYIYMYVCMHVCISIYMRQWSVNGLNMEKKDCLWGKKEGGKKSKARSVVQRERETPAPHRLSPFL